MQVTHTYSLIMGRWMLCLFSKVENHSELFGEAFWKKIEDPTVEITPGFGVQRLWFDSLLTTQLWSLRSLTQPSRLSCPSLASGKIQIYTLPLHKGLLREATNPIDVSWAKWSEGMGWGEKPTRPFGLIFTNYLKFIF